VGRSLKLLTSGQRTMSTVALQVLVGAPPLDLDAHRAAIKFKLRKGVLLDDND